MIEEMINTDDYFYEITDEGRGTIGYGCVLIKTAELVRRIHKQNKQLKRLEQENKELKNLLTDSDNALRRVNTENDELREQIEIDNETIDSFIKENKQLKSALEEIREMAIYDCKRECSNNFDTCSIESCLEKRIQRLINEVIK